MAGEFLTNLTDLNYWFGSYPGPLAGVFLAVVKFLTIGFLVVSLILRLTVRLTAPANFSRQIFNRLFNFTLTMAVLLGVSLFFSQTQTPVLGGRFWFLLWLAIALVWLGRLGWYLGRVVPRQRQAQAVKQAQNKYLP